MNETAIYRQLAKGSITLPDVFAPSTANMAECLQCGKQLGGDKPSGDFCFECASKIRFEMSLGSQVKRVWIQLRRQLTPLPLATFLLIAVNVIVYGVIASQTTTGRGGALHSMLEMNGRRVIHGEWWRLLTSAFLQVEFPHLISNVLVLLPLGWMAERLFGRLGLTVVWLAAGTAGSVAELLVRGPRIISLGSSGALFGLMGALLGVHLLGRPTISRRSRYSWLATLAIVIALNFLGEWVILGGLNPMHCGGLIMGLALGFILPIGSGLSASASRGQVVRR